MCEFERYRSIRLEEDFIDPERDEGKDGAAIAYNYDQPNLPAAATSTHSVTNTPAIPVPQEEDKPQSDDPDLPSRPYDDSDHDPDPDKGLLHHNKHAPVSKNGTNQQFALIQSIDRQAFEKRIQC